MKTKTISQVAAVLVAEWSAGAAAGTIPDSRLEIKTFENIPYISGGVGSDERDSLRAMTQGDNLQVSFALANGNYLAGAEVTIKDHGGKEVIEADADGPLFFAKLPVGNYLVQATIMGQTLTRNVSIPPKGQARVYFTWKDDGQHRTVSEHAGGVTLGGPSSKTRKGQRTHLTAGSFGVRNFSVKLSERCPGTGHRVQSRPAF